jgi:hypothetical protein
MWPKCSRPKPDCSTPKASPSNSPKALGLRLFGLSSLALGLTLIAALFLLVACLLEATA